jgi:pre-mRNA cleavage complex 2 protein Pcf11
MQCATCGIRFRPEVSEQYGAHLDWHYRQNKAEKESSKRAQSRQWYYDFPDWLKYEQFDAGGKHPNFLFHFPNFLKIRVSILTEEWMEEEIIPVEESSSEKDEPKVPMSEIDEMPNDSSDFVCASCFEPLKQSYDADLDEHVLKPAIKHDDKLFHPLCCEDYLVSTIVFDLLVHFIHSFNSRPKQLE